MHTVDTDTGELRALMTAFGPLDVKMLDVDTVRVEKMQQKHFYFQSYVIDSGTECYVWCGRNVSVNVRKMATKSGHEHFMKSEREPYALFGEVEGEKKTIF